MASAVSRQSDPLERVRWLLTWWGRWVRAGRPGPGGYVCPLGRLTGGALPSLPISDDLAEQIERAVQALKREPHRAHQGIALEMYYAGDHAMTYERLAGRLGYAKRRARRDVRDLVLRGEEWIDGYLAGMTCETAE